MEDHATEEEELRVTINRRVEDLTGVAGRARVAGDHAIERVARRRSEADHGGHAERAGRERGPRDAREGERNPRHRVRGEPYHCAMKHLRATGRMAQYPILRDRLSEQRRASGAL